MRTDKSLGSSLTFNIRKSSQIQEVLRLIQREARKEHCSESEVTLISTAVSEVCRRFMSSSESLNLTLSILSRSWGIELQGRASIIQEESNQAQWEKTMVSLSSYFNEASIYQNEDPSEVTYTFQKKIPHNN